MQLTSKYFTYPVITSDTDFYKDSLFETNAESRLEGYNIKLTLESFLENKELEEMLKKDIVTIVHHIECPQTCYREIFKTKDKIEEVILRDSQVNGVIQICSFLVANEYIERYTNDLFSGDYKGFKFDIEKGCIMAVGNQVDLRITKIRDDLVNASSIFSIIPNMDPSIIELKLNLTNNKIAIIVPEKTFALYRNMSSYMDIQPVMHSMIIIPALMHTLYELKESREQLYNYEDNRWFRGLRKACNKMDIKLDAEGLISLDIFSISQRLLDSPIIKGIEYLGEGGELNED